MRDAAIVTLELKHIDIARRRVFQDPREVKTKFRKTIETVFYPVGDGVEAIVGAWVEFLIKEKNFIPDDPLFPKTVNAHDEHRNFIPAGLGREHWANATPVRHIFKAAFERVGLPYFNPHSIRNTLTHLAYQLKLDAEQFKAWSQNMGHDNPGTTFGSYGPLTIERQAEIINGLGNAKPAIAANNMAAQIAEIHAILKNKTRQ